MILYRQKRKVAESELKKVPKGYLGRVKEKLLTRESLYAEFVKKKAEKE